MQLRVRSGHSRRERGFVGLLAALGFAAGLAAGFVGGTLFGAGGPQRVGRLVRQVRQSKPASRAGLLAETRAALAADALLGTETIELRRHGPTGIELRGWVRSRAQRARAARIAETVARGEPILNRLLVHGEDDSRVALVVDDAPRSA